MLQRKGVFQWACILFLLCSCAKPMNIKSEYDPMVRFSNFKTYDFAPGQVIDVPDKRVHNEFLDSKLRSAVEKRMAKKKFEKVSSAVPDLWVDYNAVLEKGQKIRKRLSLDIRDLGTEGGEVKRYRTHFDEGTLILTMIDPKTSRTIWRGTAQAQVTFDVTWEEREKRINRAVQKILKEFPPH